MLLQLVASQVKAMYTICNPLMSFMQKGCFLRGYLTQDSCPQQFREISDDMLRKCKGVSLAITSIASLLASHMHIETWEKIRNSLGSELDTNPTLEWMRHVLSLSYNDLSHELKTCLLYLGTYPEDYKIVKKDLVRKWKAEGFVRGKHGLDLEEAAENCFIELINRNMIQPCLDLYTDEVWGCQVHDLMLDLIISKCKEENFITIIDRKLSMNGASQARRISHQLYNRDMALTVESKSASQSQVRSYIFFPMADCMPPLSKFELLRVLDMQGRSSMESSMSLDLSAMNHLFLLRYVRVQDFDIELPKKFGKLKHLMTLDLSSPWWYHDQQLVDFSSLSSLRHLGLPGRVAFKSGLSKLRNLLELSGFSIEANSIECIRELGELTNLRTLTMAYYYSRPGGVENNDLDKILAASLDKLGNSNLRRLDFFMRDRALSAQFWSNCLSRPRYLHNLILPCSIPKVPKWIAHADRLAYLHVLQVEELRSDDIQVLGQLSRLISLQLTAKTIPEENIIIHPNTFPGLKRFHFSCELSCRLKFEPAAMPRLQSLDIQLDGRRQGGAIQVQEGSPVGGIEHLASLVDIRINVEISGKCGHGAKIESACRDAINRHPKSQDILVRVSCIEVDEIWCSGRKTKRDC